MSEKIVLITKKGYCIKHNVKDLPLKETIKVIELTANDKVISMRIVK